MRSTFFPLRNHHQRPCCNVALYFCLVDRFVGQQPPTPACKQAAARGGRRKESAFPFYRSIPSLPERSAEKIQGESGGFGGWKLRMDRKVVAVCVGVAFLGLLSAALAFAAEATRTQASDVQTEDGLCIYPKSPALVLGCICCKKHSGPPNTNWTIGLISFIASWVSFILAFLLLLTGAALNDQRSQEMMYFGYCYVVKPGVFAGGAVLSLASIALGIVYYVALSSQNAQICDTQQNQGIAMGNPQFPAHVTPVFVHEDTYNRRQFP
ncbi:uncharacterized protein LOC122007867 isoform X2 [Zingiber officinale]|uniref:uncharacterized protein LOC122007867 isoform X2 n=1 Tax=Zingiber officinale TaxID=94328 RepID=UPI001C4D0EBF|nr:uncharacterized protein LOC122007867 isoform X2 [Zingiber officinale]